MAAPSNTVWGSIVGSYGRIGISTSTSSTNTTTSVTVQVWLWTKYSCYDSSNTFYYDNNATTAATSKGSVSINHTNDSGSGWSESNQTLLGTYSYSYARRSNAQTNYCAAKLTGIDRIGGTMTVYTSYTVPALAAYTISFNANGGTGAPSSQVKYYGVDITLSSTTPTRQGYTFKGWGTSASATSATYAAGATYSGNANATLYAVWAANTYTVSYNANGGTDAPASQTKTHGVTLTLSTAVPTRTNYNFVGWGISAGASEATYAAGGQYTANSDITLYAVWELAYIKPRINNYTASRCDASGTLTDEGTYILVAFDWETDYAASSIKIDWGTASETLTASGTSGSVNEIVGAGAIATDEAYTVKVTVADSVDSSTKSLTVSGMAFPIDVYPGKQGGVTFGGPATKAGVADFRYPILDRFNTSIGNGLAQYGAGDAAIDPDTTTESLILTNKNTPVANSFFFIQTLFYSSKTATANRAQFAVAYKQHEATYCRYYTSGAWGEWVNTALAAYPVGSYYITHSSASPAELFGGTWRRIESRFLYGCASTGTLGATGGASTHTHGALNSNNGTLEALVGSPSGSPQGFAYAASNKNTLINPTYAMTGTRNTTLESKTMAHNAAIRGETASGSTMPPYVNVAIWRREA